MATKAKKSTKSKAKKAETEKESPKSEVLSFVDVVDSIKRLMADMEKDGTKAPFLERYRAVIEKADKYLAIAEKSAPDTHQTKTVRLNREQLAAEFKALK